MKKTAVLSLLVTSILMGENLLKNGSFENFNKDVRKWGYVYLDNWNARGEVWARNVGAFPIDGDYKIELDSDRSLDELFQVITTQKGKKYLFRVDAYARKDGTSDFELLVDGEVIARVSPTKSWSKYGATFIGKGGEQIVSIREIESQNNGYGAIIDNAVVQSDITNLDEIKLQDFKTTEIVEPWGLDQIEEIIDNDRGLRRFSQQDLDAAKNAALQMNTIIKEAIKENALVNDGVITGSDALEIQNYIFNNYKSKFKDLRRTFYKIERGGLTQALNKNALKDVWGNIYNLGYKKLTKNQYQEVTYMLDSIINKEELKNPNYKEVEGSTNTKLDEIVGVILNDRGLNTNNKKSDLRDGAKYANEMNKILKKAIIDTAVANDGKISTSDARTLNEYLVENYEDEWAELHGDDERRAEYGYHLVQNDGATTRMYGDNVINTIADGIYHLGFKTRYKDNLVNEDGNKNQTFEDVAWWLDVSLKEDIKAGKFTNKEYQEVVGTTGTAMDKIVPTIFNDEGLQAKVSTEDMRVAAKNANRMNELLIEAIKETGVAQDKFFSAEDMKKVNEYLVENYEDEWAELHGDDERRAETGFHRIQNDGAVTRLEGNNLINTVADGVYHLGFKTKYKDNLVNEDGNKNQTFYSVAYWLNRYLQEELLDGRLVK